MRWNHPALFWLICAGFLARCETPVQKKTVVTAQWSDGTTHREVDVAAGDSIAVRMYHENGSLEKTGHYQNGLKHDAWRSFYPDGTPWSEHHYEKGIQIGDYKTWHPNGQQFISGSYDDQGQPNGEWGFQSAEGELMRRVRGDSLR